MASRILHGSRAPKHRPKEQDTADKPTALPRRAPTISSVASSSKPSPHSTSLFSRSRTTKAELRPAASVQPSATRQRAAEERIRPAPTPKEDMQRDTSSIPRGMEPGMGVRTEVIARGPPPRNRLRRKASSQDPRGQYSHSEASHSSHEIRLQAQTQSDAMSSSAAHHDPYLNTVLGITLPPAASSISAGAISSSTPTEYATSSSRMDTYISQNPHRVDSSDLPPPPAFNFPARSSTSSTRCSESPGPFSRTSTPTSASSFSPSTHQTPKFASRARQASSPISTRPPVTRRKLGPVGRTEDRPENQGLPAVRESITSSSSSSTVKGPEPPQERPEATQPTQIYGPDALASAAPLRLPSKKLQKALALERHLPSTVSATTGSGIGVKHKALPVPQTGAAASRHPALSTQQNRMPPPRPSREGTPILESSRNLPVIQSNLSHLATTGHKRRESVEKAVSASSTESIPPRSANPLPLTRTSSTYSSSTGHWSRAPVTPDFGRPNNSSNILLDTRTQDNAPHVRREPSRPDAPGRIPTPVTASPSKLGGRLGIFSKKTKSSVEPASAPIPERLPRKGPAAGTGHEGYGKYARRGRSSSTSTAASRNRSTSTDRSSASFVRPLGSRKGSFTSVASDAGPPGLDEFYRDRLEPVVIGGGGRIRENRNSGSGPYRMPSGQSSVTSVESGSYAATAASSTSRVSLGEPQPQLRSLLPAPNITGLNAEDNRFQPPTLAHRRSMHRSQLLGEGETPRIPAPIRTRALAPSPVLETYDSTLSSAPRTENSLFTDDVSEGHEGAWLRSKKKTPEKGKLNRKWNFFHRPSRSPEPPSLRSNDSFGNHSELSATPVSGYAEPSTVAHYTMMDEEEPEHQDLNSRLREIESTLDLEGDDGGDPFISPIQPRQPSMLLPSPLTYNAEFSTPNRPTSPKVVLNFDALPPLPPKNPSRLPQVGRIPRVVSKSRRDRLHNPSPQSFSRPFVPRTSLDETISTTSSTLVERPILAVETEPLKQASWTSWTPQSAQPASAPATNAMLYNLDGEKEFITFSPRQGSMVSGSGSSGMVDLAPITAVASPPEPMLSEDEVWNEFDELLDRVVSPATFDSCSPEAGQSTLSIPFFDSVPQAPGSERSRAASARDRSKDAPGSEKAQEPSARDRSENVFGKPAQGVRPMLPARTDSLRATAEPEHLASPVSFSNVYTNYGNRASREKSPVRQSVSSTVSGSVYSSQTVVSNTGSRSSTNSIVPEQRITKAMAEKISKSPDDSLRFSALMTSRWLSFDRVLFSPVQEEIRTNRQDRVLIVDGLENDDWSCYCALTYPDATFYNLSAAPVASWINNSPAGGKAAQWSPPINHRRISHASIFAPFPFPKGFFTAAVLRFPAANPLPAYRNLVSECKRVLRPGGYLEFSVLDVDLVNAGPRARRAVRALKTRVQARSPETSLSPVSDTLTRLLGRRGFEKLHSCVVGVPVAGVLSDGAASRSTSIDDQAPPSAAASAVVENDTRPTLSALLAGPTGGAVPHYPMARMVSHVGRYWWSRCYETARTRGSDAASIWAERALLAECEQCETGLRLLVGYAQKPVSVRRRTVSV